jgi:hypothetical protein
MEPITYTLIISAAIFVVAVPVAITKRLNKKSKHADAARKRAAMRKQERAFANTSPMSKNTVPTGVEFDLHIGKSAGGEVLPLTQEQEDTIRLIFKGYHPPLKREKHFRAGPDVNTAAGVPVSMSAFDELNVVDSNYGVEYLEPNYVWPESYK